MGVGVGWGGGGGGKESIIVFVSGPSPLGTKVLSLYAVFATTEGLYIRHLSFLCTQIVTLLGTDGTVSYQCRSAVFSLRDLSVAFEHLYSAYAPATRRCQLSLRCTDPLPFVHGHQLAESASLLCIVFALMHKRMPYRTQQIKGFQQQLL